MLSQLKMNPDPAYQNRLLPERDNASFFDGYSVWFYKEQGDLQQANAFTLEFEIAPFGISSEGDAIFSCMDRKTSEGMAVRLTSDRKVEVILGFGGRQMVFYSIRENVDLEKWNHIFVIYRFREGWCDLVVNGVLSNRAARSWTSSRACSASRKAKSLPTADFPFRLPDASAAAVWLPFSRSTRRFTAK